MRILHAELRSLGVHHQDECLGRAREVFGDRYRGVIGRMHDDRLHHVVERESFALLEVDL